MNTEKMTVQKCKGGTWLYFNKNLKFYGTKQQAIEFAKKHNFGGGVELVTITPTEDNHHCKSVEYNRFPEDYEVNSSEEIIKRYKGKSNMSLLEISKILHLLMEK